MTVLTPKVLLPLVWPLPLSLATTRGISVDFSSSRYLDVSVPGVPLMHLLIQCMIHGSSPCVFPHSEICGSMLICSSPQLIAACHVLLRLLMPRHSPYALIRLNFLFSFEISVLLNCLSFSKHLGLHIALKRFSFFMLYLIHHSVNCSNYPNRKDQFHFFDLASLVSIIRNPFS